MPMRTIPLAKPADLLDEVRRTADQPDLSSADIMRQAIKAGLPQVRQALSVKASLGDLKPFTKDECRQCWGPGSDAEKYRIAAAMCQVAVPPHAS